MTKKGLYEIGFLGERMREVEAMLESWDEGSQAYLIAKELREIYGYLLADAGGIGDDIHLYVPAAAAHADGLMIVYMRFRIHILKNPRNHERALLKETAPGVFVVSKGG